MRQVDTALEPLQQALSADGASLSFCGIDGEELRLRLNTTDHACAECIVSDEIIESIVLTRLASLQDPELAGVRRVQVEHLDAADGATRVPASESSQ